MVPIPAGIKSVIERGDILLIWTVLFGQDRSATLFLWSISFLIPKKANSPKNSAKFFWGNIGHSFTAQPFQPFQNFIPSFWSYFLHFEVPGYLETLAVFFSEQTSCTEKVAFNRQTLIA